MNGGPGRQRQQLAEFIGVRELQRQLEGRRKTISVEKVMVPMRKGACPKCGASEVVRDVRIMDRGHGSADAGDLSAVVYGNPQAWIFKGKVRIELSACVCGGCGYTELYASEPSALLAAARSGEL